MYTCFIQTLVTACTISDILAQVDHKDTNLLFSNLANDL